MIQQFLSKTFSMRRNNIIVVALLCTCANSFGQQIFQDGSGESTLYLGDWNYSWARFNSSADKVSIGINRLRRSGSDLEEASFLGGVELAVKAKDGKADFFSKKAFNSGIEFSVLAGLHSFEALDSNNSSAAIFIRPGLSYNKYNIVNEAIPSDPKINKVQSVAAQLMLHVNLQLNRPFLADDPKRDIKKGNDHLYHFVGFSTGYRRANNLSDLTQVEIGTTTSASATQNVTTVETGYSGIFKDFDQFAINLDYGILPRIFRSHSVGFNYFLRSGFASEVNTATTGIGIFFAKPNEPSNILGGLALQSSDIFNGYRKETDAWERSILFFYVGFNIKAK